MFEEIAGLPAHPLVIHAAVVFIPLLALGAIAYVALSSQRFRLRWVVALLAPAAALSAVVAKLSGDAFRHRLVTRNPTLSMVDIDRHRMFGNLTTALTVLLAIVTLALLAAIPATTKGGDDARRGGGFVVRLLLSIVTVLLAAGALYFVVRTGDLGARMVWGHS